MVNIDGLSFGYGRGALFQGARARSYPRQHLWVAGRQRRRQVDAAEAHLGVAVRNARERFARSATTRPRASRASCSTCSCCPRTRRRRTCSPATIYGRGRRSIHASIARCSTATSREFELPTSGNLAALSHGQQKKFLLAFGLATQAKLVLLDEPTNGLDIPSKSLLRRVVAEALTDDRLFVISTHQVRDLGTLMDPIVILHQGRVLLNRTLAEIGARLHMTQQTSPPPADAPNLLVQRARCRRVLVGVARRCRRAARSRGAVQRDRREAGPRSVGVRCHGRCRVNDQLSWQRLGLMLRSDLLRSLSLGARHLGHGRARRAAGFTRHRVRRRRGLGAAVLSSLLHRRVVRVGHDRARACASAICTAAGPTRRFCCCRLRRSRRPCLGCCIHTVGLDRLLARVHDGAVVGARGHQHAARSGCGASSSRRSIESRGCWCRTSSSRRRCSSSAPRGFARSSSSRRSAPRWRSSSVSLARPSRSPGCSAARWSDATIRIDGDAPAARVARRRSPVCSTSMRCRCFAGSWRGCA